MRRESSASKLVLSIMAALRMRDYVDDPAAYPIAKRPPCTRREDQRGFPAVVCTALRVNSQVFGPVRPEPDILRM